MEEIIEAAKKSYLHDFVMTLPDVSYAFLSFMTDDLDLQICRGSCYYGQLGIL